MTRSSFWLELGIERIFGLANKLRDDSDREVVSRYAASHALDLIGDVPYDDDLRRAEQRRVAPLETDARALEPLGAIAVRLLY